MKFSTWLNIFTTLGGQLIIKKVDLDDVKLLGAHHELVISATGKGELGSLFKRDDSRSIFQNPMRTLACLYFKRPSEMETPSIRVHLVDADYVRCLLA